MPISNSGASHAGPRAVHGCATHVAGLDHVGGHSHFVRSAATSAGRYAKQLSDRAYTEDQLVEQPAIGLFAELGWQTVSALERLNPALPAEAITAAVDELTRDRSTMIPGLPFYLKRSVYCSVKHSI